MPLTFLYPSAKPHKIYQDFIDEFKNAENLAVLLKSLIAAFGKMAEGKRN